LQALSDATAAWPLLPALFHPDRWLLWLGVLFVLIVYFFPRHRRQFEAAPRLTYYPLDRPRE